MATDVMKLKEEVFSIFEKAPNQHDALRGIYQLLSPRGKDPDAGVPPLCGHKLYRFITGLFCSYDYEKHPERPCGRLWFDKGFVRSFRVPDWEVDLAPPAADGKSCFT
jgi:predicted transcriptional regulator